LALKFLADMPHASISCKPRDVFHHDRLWPEVTNESHELKDKIVSSVTRLLPAIQCGHGGKALARRATREKVELSSTNLQGTLDLTSREQANVRLQHSDPLVVPAVGFDRQVIHFDGSDHVEACLPKTQGQTTAPGEQVNGFGFAFEGR